ncbi:integral component of membrane [Sergentomyia squamirostris]
MEKLVVISCLTLLLTALVLGHNDHTNIVIGNRVPGEIFLGFKENATINTATPQTHEVHVFFQGVPGNNITFVDVRMFPGFNRLRFPVLGQQSHNFWIDVCLENTTYLNANMYIYGFNPTLTGEPGSLKSSELYADSPSMITLTNN